MKLKTESAVSAVDYWLGRVAGAAPGWWRRLGDTEARFYGRAVTGRPIDRPVYITGLARSGTTLLLEFLAAHDQTATHRYRDYPFLHTPVWWNRFLDRAARQETRAVERLHQDRIFITSRSPEAMEEVLWMAFFPDCHMPGAGRVFDADARHPAFEAFYKEHIRKILFLRRGTRYVSKANYHITRLEYLKRLFPDARFVIPVRSPAGHIASLGRQHRHFRTRQENDPRLLDYMRRSGHFEFGLDRRPVNTGDSEMTSRILKLWAEGEDVHGLALVWKSVYGFLADRLMSDEAMRAAILVVDYESLCASPETWLKRIYNHCGLKITGRTIREQSRAVSAPTHRSFPFSERERALIKAETNDVYEQVLRYSRSSVDNFMS